MSKQELAKNGQAIKAIGRNESGRRSSGFSRRTVLGGAGVLAAGSVLAQGAAARSSLAGGGSRPTLVQVFLRGAMDGLTTVVPHADGDYYAARPNLAVPAPGNPNGATDLDGFFGLAPSATPLMTPYSNGHLVIVHASGSLDPTRSHFDAFTRMEFGDPNLPLGSVEGGWITRYLKETTASGVLRAIGASYILPFSLDGAPSTLPIPDLANFSLPGAAGSAALRVSTLSSTYGPKPAPVGPAALDTLASIALLGGVDFAGYVPANGALYPNSLLGTRLRNTAALIKSGVGVEVITIDVDGWDLHASLGPINGSMAALLDDLTRSIEAFYLDMLAFLSDYVLLGISEFGRRVAENGSDGCDHGHGNAMFVMGDGLSGGQVIANWPGLSVFDLDNGDLAITTDYRDVIGEVLGGRMGLSPASLARVFPLHTFSPVGVTL